MGYTAPEQQIEKPLAKALEALEELRSVMLHRLQDSTATWDALHKAELRVAVTDITGLQMTLTKLL